jgi:hypothetical protein
MSESVNTIRKNVIKAVKEIIKDELSKPLDSKAANALKRVLRKIEKGLPY